MLKKLFQNIYKKAMLTRQDDMSLARYFTAADFEGLHTAPYSFVTDKGNRLNGLFYYYDSPRADRLVVFDHGMGPGHLAYTKEIERIAREGYLVFSYDHTGCATSEGAHIGGFAQSLADLDSCLTALGGQEALRGRSISVIGHSWGGFSTMNIAALHPEVTHIAALAGFVSPRIILSQMLPPFLSRYTDAMLEAEREQNGRYADFDARESLANSSVKALLIYSEDDPLVKYDRNFLPLRDALRDKENVRFILTADRGHNPNFTAEAVKIKNEAFALRDTLKKKKQLETPEQKQAFVAAQDWDAITEQDEALWQKIFAHLES
ncbi:MAG: alpha/beta fold hydrolase [Oscillospiraceae bacterium]|nr:alpha/beta fold hydrolase [Oscillospiraceae bacterium]